MTEQALDRRFPEQTAGPFTDQLPRVSVLSEYAVRASLTERGFHILEPDTTVLLHAEVSKSDPAHIFYMEPVELVEGVEVVLARKPIIHPGLPLGLKPLVLIPDSENRRMAVKARDLAGEHYDVDAVRASSDTIRREDARLARSLLSGRGNIDPGSLTRVQITAAKF